MNRVNEGEFIEILRGLENKSITISLSGGIESKIHIHKMAYIIKDNTIILRDTEAENSIVIDLNLAYKTLANANKDKAQVNIDTLNEDIIITVDS